MKLPNETRSALAAGGPLAGGSARKRPIAVRKGHVSKHAERFPTFTSCALLPGGYSHWEVVQVCATFKTPFFQAILFVFEDPPF